MKDLGLLLLRLVTGGTLIAHGYPKLFGGEGKQPPGSLTRAFGQNFPQTVSEGGPVKFSQHLEQMGVPYPTIGAYLSGLAEFGGGIGILTGTMTRLAALAVCANMGVAIWRVHWKNGLIGPGGYEFPSHILATAATLFLAGPGAISVDGLFGGVKRGARAVSCGGQAVAEAASDVQKRGARVAGAVASQVASQAEGIRSSH